jgi:hypothetical protein
MIHFQGGYFNFQDHRTASLDKLRDGLISDAKHGKTLCEDDPTFLKQIVSRNIHFNLKMPSQKRVPSMNTLRIFINRARLHSYLIKKF